ncbi:MAG: SxtJ family membrane protein [Lentimicrobiaceae bacterium]|nr:SxtJ family membrane protein [Lentimicrobiaceae bacterium]
MKEKRIKSLEFILLITAILVIIFFIFRYILFLYIAITIAAIGLFFPQITLHLYKGWDWIGQGIRYCVTHLILFIIFYFILFPISILYKLKNKDPLKLTNKNLFSYYDLRDKNFSDNDFEKMW